MYAALLKYVLPLILVSMSIDISDTVLNAGLVLASTNLNSTTNTTFAAATPSSSFSTPPPATNADQISRLAAFGAAHRILRWVWSGSWEMRAVGIRLVRQRNQYYPALCFAITMSASCSFFMCLMALTPFGNWITGIPVQTEAGTLLSTALLALSLLPVLKAVDKLHEGLLLQKKQTLWVSASGVLDLLTQLIVLAVVLDPEGTPKEERSNPMLAPIAALYIGMLCKMCLVGVGIVVVFVYGGDGSSSSTTTDKRQYKHSSLEEEMDREDEQKHARRPPPAAATPHRSSCCAFVWQIVYLWWPLAWVKAFQGLSRPLMNLLVASSPGGVSGVAVLTLCFPLGHLFYGGLNNLKGIAAAFMDVKGSLPYVRKFIPMAFVTSLIGGFIFLWSPATNGIGALRILLSFGADVDLVQRCIVPLRIFSFFCFAVGTRNYFTALAVLNKNTKPLAYSGPIRITVIVVMGWGVFSAGFGLSGGTLGIATLFSGFVAEALAVLVCTQCCCGKQKGNVAVPLSIVDEEEEEIFSTAGVALDMGEGNNMEGSRVLELSPQHDDHDHDHDHELYQNVRALFEVTFPWTEKLLAGEKTIETRTYALPPRYLLQTVALYETDGTGNVGVLDRCVGLIEFSGCKEYKTKEEWRKDSKHHCVPGDAAPEDYGWVEGVPRFGWTVQYVRRTKRHPLPMDMTKDFRSFFTVKTW